MNQWQFSDSGLPLRRFHKRYPSTASATETNTSTTTSTITCTTSSWLDRLNMIFVVDSKYSQECRRHLCPPVHHRSPYPISRKNSYFLCTYRLIDFMKSFSYTFPIFQYPPHLLSLFRVQDQCGLMGHKRKWSEHNRNFLQTAYGVLLPGLLLISVKKGLPISAANKHDFWLSVRVVKVVGVQDPNIGDH